MNLVCLESKTDWELVRSFFENENWLYAKPVSNEKELVFVLEWKKKQPDFSLGILLSKLDSRLLNKAKHAGLWVSVLGNSLAACQFAVQQKADALVQPFGVQKPFFDLSVLRVAFQNGVRVGVLFSDFLHASQTERVHWLSNTFFLARCCKKTKVSFVVWSGAKTVFDVRSENDLEEIGAFLRQ